MKYKYTIQRDDDSDSYAVFFPEIPEALTVVYSLEDLEKESIDCLHSAFEIYADEKREIPLGLCADDELGIELPASLSLKVILYNEVLKSNLKKIDIARKANIAQPNFERLLNFRYTAKIDAIENVLKALGRKINISLA
ncbi:type II toxin-antitoxin system HicB family antitoxin [Francisella tularensis]|uniref:type II toxin-antitoxin system HicB family antitoxin n=1 Tax=Francisella tularensis TaxID=263 RepID=UPI0008F4743D|nr:hypothetical protein [Francisella tularensis]APA83249.1 hypothetical protein N894_1265 [Francisella tularensis subsp. novicida PA10-7858]